MRNFEKYFVVAVATTMILLANTVSATFNPKPLLNTQSTREFSANENSTVHTGKSNNNSYSLFGKLNDQKSRKSFLDFGLFDASEGDRWFNELGNYGDFVVDEDSMELVIGINSDYPKNYDNLVDLLGGFGGKVVNTVSMKGEVIAIVVDAPLNAVSLLKKEVQSVGLARYVEPNMKFQAQFVPNDPYWSMQWGPQKIEADWAWNTTIGDKSILVAVIDTGIDYTHPDLAANYVALGYDWVNNDADPLDDCGHGTHCAGIIAAVLNNSVGIAGVAQVRIMAEKGLDAYGYGTEDDLANAIIHAVDQGANILSNSWGGYGESYLIHDAVQYAYNHSVLVIAAAGNDATSLKPIPAGYEEVVAVTATDQSDAPAWFTNFGDWVEVAAPGVDIYSTMPTYNVTLNDYGYSMNYSYMSGTSMACPHAAGVAALIWSQFPNATRDWVRAQLRFTADDLGNPGFDKYYGYGRINARKAVEQSPPEHDLLIFDWNRPRYVKLGELTTFNVTVLNFGVNNETGIEVDLLVNSSLVDSKSIDSLERYASTTVSLSWTPGEVGIHNITYYVAPTPNETEVQNNQITEFLYVVTPPSETGWMLLETDPDEGYGCNLKSIYGQASSDVIYFKAEYHKNWTTINDIDTGILIDADQDPTTGLPDRTYPGQNTGIGADYLIVVGWEATEMWRWDPITRMWDISNPIPLAYLEATENSTVFIVGVFFTDVETSGIIDCAVADILSNWDWMPDSGHFTWIVIQYEHELAVLLKTPLYLPLGETSLVNATVCNRGLNNETNVEIRLIINGTTVANETLAELPNGTCYKLTFLWEPTEKGTYNVTAYAPPVPDENITRNNVYSKIIPVQYAPKILAYIQYTDYYYDYQNTIRAIESAFGPNYNLTEFRDYNQLNSMLPGKDILLIPDQEYASLSTLQMIGGAWAATLNDFLENGGIIILCDGDWGYGITYGILTGAGLMSISSTNYRSYYTLYLVDPSDPLAEGVSQTFISPYYTVSFVTQETKVVINDGFYPVVIRKEVGRGQIVLLGFDFEYSNNNTERLLGNAVALTTYITISLNPSAGSPGTKVTLTGTRASANGNVSIYWDGSLMANTTANNVGDFSYILTVPEDATIGVHEIMAVDTATGKTASALFRVIIITLNPSEGPVGTKVTVNGEGFTPQTQAPITFNDMHIGYAFVDAFGNFTFVFNVPISMAEMQIIKAFEAEGYASATFTVIDVTPLDVQIDVGVVHFRGEIAEFYSQTVFKGIAVNATKLTAILYGPNGETFSYSYPENITLIATGLYKTLFNIPVTADTGTYTLVINAEYVTDTVQASGTSFKSFLVSDTLTLMNNKIAEIHEGIATVQTELGFVRLNLTAMNVTLENIFLQVIAINGITATIQTTLGIMNGTITGTVSGDIATVVVPGLGQIQTDISNFKAVQEAGIIPQYVVITMALIAAVSSTLSLIFLIRRKTT